ncbi:hypothetical protein IQ238_09865 [Pleurocapsales cyanobacterium LEGE 06147]|nr:hypothetical protein [Pleurocapsales cyanobacterium LEGE 06147]
MRLAKKLGVETFLQLAVLILVISIFLKGIIDVDTGWDTWVYHLPFAARIWRIVPPELYLFEDHEEFRFAGFPLLAQFLQGFFWFITGRLQAANLVGFFSLALYLFFLKLYFKVPLYLSAIALLAIPLVQIHATSCYVDLPANIGMSILVLMTYFLYKQKDFPTKWDLLVIVLAAAGASNIKPQLQPLVFLILCFLGLRIAWLGWRQADAPKQWLLKAIPITLVASLIIFATPIKNVVIYGNPFYPVRIEIVGKVLNHKLGLYSDSPDYLKNVSPSQRWLYSIVEINSPEWSVDQYSLDESQNRMGGFFGVYVVFNLILFGYIAFRDWLRSRGMKEINYFRETIVAVIVVAIMTTVAANFPQSHELRYYMYWMISLVSLNLALITRRVRETPRLWRDRSFPNSKLFNSYTVGVVYLFFLAVVIAKTEFFYIKPNFYTLEQHIQNYTDSNVIAAIKPGDEVCLVGKQPHTFLYASKFHPYLNYTYSIKSAGEPNLCAGREKIL